MADIRFPVELDNRIPSGAALSLDANDAFLISDSINITRPNTSQYIRYADLKEVLRLDIGSGSGGTGLELIDESGKKGWRFTNMDQNFYGDIGLSAVDESISNTLGSNGATGDYSHSEGYETTSIGMYSHAEGYNTTSSGDYSHAEGQNNTSSGDRSHSEGINTTASGNSSHTEGSDNTASGQDAHAEGNGTTASGNSSHTEGYYTKSTSFCTHSEGYITESNGMYSHAEGNGSISNGLNSHAEGYMTESTGDNSHAEGSTTITIGDNSHAEGFETRSELINAHAEGNGSIARGKHSHAEGSYTTASGCSSHTEGYSNNAIGAYSHAEGQKSSAEGITSHSEGDNTIATGDYSHAEGTHTVAMNEGSHTAGMYNIGSATDTIHETGIGTSTIRKNAFEIYMDGTLTAPESTITNINSRGINALITKEYVDSKFNPLPGYGESGGDITTSDITTSLGNIWYKTVTSNITFTFTNTFELTGFILKLTNAGSYTITWPISVKWSGGSIPVLTTGEDILSFTTFDSGITWYGMTQLNFI